MPTQSKWLCLESKTRVAVPGSLTRWILNNRGASWSAKSWTYRWVYVSWSISATALALAAVEARRTALAFPNFVATHGYDVYCFDNKLPGLVRLPGVASVTPVVSPG